MIDRVDCIWQDIYAFTAKDTHTHIHIYRFITIHLPHFTGKPVQHRSSLLHVTRSEPNTDNRFRCFHIFKNVSSHFAVL